MSAGERGSEGDGPGRAPKLPAAPENWDGEGALQDAVESHVLADARHDTPEEAYTAALGSIILSYLDSLAPKEYLIALLTLKGPEGYPEERLLSQANDQAERTALLSAGRELASQGKLKRVRNAITGELFWRPAGPLLAEDRTPEPGTRAGTRAGTRTDADPPSPRRATDDGPAEGGSAM